ncbi:MAG: diguanylate cyclase [Cohaesibacter sp.]|nr:diguanylate cyclase [Cohaesibacter sp.]
MQPTMSMEATIAKKSKRLLPHWLFFALLIGLVSAALSFSGQFATLDQKLSDLRTFSSPVSASGQIMIVAIDEATASAYGGYPIPRKHLAQLLEKLAQSQADRIYMDVVFGYLGQKQQDIALLQAMDKLGPDRLALPQASISPNKQKEDKLTSLPPFTQSVSQVAADLVADSKDLTRQIGLGEKKASPSLPNPAQWLTRREQGRSAPVQIDLSIDPKTVPVLTMMEILKPDFPLQSLSGKTLIIGVSIRGIGKPIQLPHYGQASRPLVFALGAETMQQNRHIHTLPLAQMTWVCIAGLILLAAIIQSLPIWLGAALVIVSIIGLNELALVARNAYRLELATAMPVFALMMLLITYLFTRLSVFKSHRQALGNLLGWASFGHLNVFEHGEDAILTFSPDGEVLSFNPSAEQLFQIQAEQVIGKPISTILPNHTMKALTSSAEQKSGRLQTELDNKEYGNRHLDLSYSAMSMKDEWLGMVSIRDITEFKNREAQLAYEASHDALTGLANRAGLESHYQKTLEQYKQDQKAFGVMLFDLDKFKQINDSQGHHAGDCVLQTIANRIQKISREQDFAARLGGDEFAIILKPSMTQKTAQTVAHRLLSEISSPMMIEGNTLHVGVSIGIALATPHHNSMKEMMHAADMALYRVKEQGRNNFAFAVKSDLPNQTGA